MEIIEYLKAALFGIVEGITEWLPISSTGHMILLKELLPLNVSEEFWNMFEVVIQFGAVGRHVVHAIVGGYPLLVVLRHSDVENFGTFTQVTSALA